MFARIGQMPDPTTAVGQAVLHEQYSTLSRQIPVMYASLLINSVFLGFATFSTAPLWLSVGVPATLGVLVLLRLLIWLRRRNAPIPDVLQIARFLRITLIAGSLLSLIFGGWGQLLFTEATLAQRSCIGLFIFINCVSVCYSLQCLPWAGRLVLLLGGVPMALRLLMTGDWLLIGLGLNIIFISFLILRVLGTNYAAFTGVLSSRSEVIAERERALKAEARASSLAYGDALTGLPNRNALCERMDELFGEGREPTNLALLIVDLDRFKPINDVHGHLAGDELLCEVAHRLRTLVPAATAYRLGGDEFALLIENFDAALEAPWQFAHRLVHGLGEPFHIRDLVHHISASIGISLYPADAKEREGLMRRADIALYRAKDGRNQYRAFEPAMEAQITRRAVIERELRYAIAHDELRPFYQPMVNLSTSRAVGFELLARWPRGDSEAIGPDQFVPVAEETGLINEMMLKLLERACEDVRDWDPALRLAINVSPVQLRDPWLSQKVLATLIRMRLPPQRLAIEITENALIDDADNARRTIESFKNLGMQIELDDFGTGYSSLAHLRMLPFDKIKIDRSFVQAIGDDPEALKIIRAINSLAGSLDLPVIAEGIESESVATQLRELGCAEGQGHYFGEAVSGDRISAIMNGRPRHRWTGTGIAQVA